MSRMSNLERLVHYQDELEEMWKAGEDGSERYNELKSKIQELEKIMPKYRPHVYRNVREGKNNGKIK